MFQRIHRPQGARKGGPIRALQATLLLTILAALATPAYSHVVGVSQGEFSADLEADHSIMWVCYNWELDGVERGYGEYRARSGVLVSNLEAPWKPTGCWDYLAGHEIASIRVCETKPVVACSGWKAA